jgi:hypothetical protein
MFLALLVPVFALPQYPGQVTKSTKDAPELRSIAVLEWTGEAGKPKASRIVPVAVFDAGQLQDGGIYLARPEPLALAGEVEYELQRNGQTIGLFDIKNSGREQGSWVGYGTWKSAPVEKPKNPTDELAKIKVEDEDSDRPVLHRKKHPGEAAPNLPQTASADSDKSGDRSESSDSASPFDPDRPVLHKKSSDTASSTPTSANTAPAPDTASDPDRPVLHKKTNDASAAPSDPDRPVLKTKRQKQPEDEAHVDSVTGSTDPDRPRLKRGKPSGYQLNVVPSLLGLPPDLQQVVAVSDARPYSEHSWSFSWANPDDELKMKAQLEDVARDALGLKPSPAPAVSPAKAKSTSRKKPLPDPEPAPPPPPATLTNEQFRVFELSFSSGATLVLSAQTDGSHGPRKFVTLIAQPDFYGNLLILQKSVTDATQLDEKPRMILIDAVDALADNRGELLFELRGATQRQFALYRVLRGRTEKLFAGSGGEFGSSVSQ